MRNACTEVTSIQGYAFKQRNITILGIFLRHGQFSGSIPRSKCMETGM